MLSDEQAAETTMIAWIASGWLMQDQVLDAFAVGQSTPGPLLGAAMGLTFLPKKKQRQESSFAERSPACSDDNQRDFPATEKQKRSARELGIEFSPGISRGDLSDLIKKKRASER
jgi:hypothetical protein